MYMCICIYLYLYLYGCIHVDDSAYFYVPELQNGYSYDRCCVHSHVCIIIYELMFMFSLVSVNMYLSSHTSSFDQHHK